MTLKIKRKKINNQYLNLYAFQIGHIIRKLQLIKIIDEIEVISSSIKLEKKI